jgi:hypothetical protein
MSRLPARRIAGIDAAGLRLSASGQPPSVLSHVDIWADPATGLAVEAEVYGAGQAAPVLVSKFLDVRLAAPAAALVRPQPAPGVRFAAGSFPDARRILSQAAPRLPAALTGVTAPDGRTEVMPRVPDPAGLGDVAAYGTGLARFAVVPLPGSTGRQLLTAAASAGTPVQLGAVTAVGFATALLTVLIAQPPGAPVYLLAGTVTAPVLEKAAQQLPGYRR